ncbi:hypothetical protein N9801_01925 [Yoonia sp.]|nr:hypothetical protein [Yoonia sp.]MDB4241000.1 hypothetical protein [Yoonia sp.]
MTGTVLSMLATVSRHGRAALIVGLLAGVMLPSFANAMKPWLPLLVMVLLFLVALRIGPRKARDGLSNLPATLGVVLVLQLVLPLVVIAFAAIFGMSHTAYVLAVVLVLAAPSVSGSPNLAIILGADPEPAFRLLIVGTVLLPLTILPIFWLLPQFGDLAMAATPALRTLGAIVLAMGAGFLVRAYGLPNLKPIQSDALDGAMSVALAVLVIGLMAALRPALAVSVSTVAGWMALAFGLNIGMQLLSFLVLRGVLPAQEVVPVSIVVGNRNIAIFLIALSESSAEPLLIFLACYQVPMYLTPLLMDRLYRSARCAG